MIYRLTPEEVSSMDITVFKNSVTGKWEEGYPYMQWPKDKHGRHLMPGDWFFSWRIKGYDYEYMIPGSFGTDMATECKTIHGNFISGSV
jgi:hypothetical protein